MINDELIIYFYVGGGRLGSFQIIFDKQAWNNLV